MGAKGEKKVRRKPKKGTAAPLSNDGLGQTLEATLIPLQHRH
jgi:hypothetical protein